jgi:hypothetical protein
MPITKNTARKFGLVAEILINKADLVTAVEAPIIDMPAGAVIDDCYLAVDELFDPTTSAVIEVGTSDDTDKFVASQNIFTGQALGGRAGAATGKGYKFAAGGSIYAKYTTGGGLATVGKVRVVVLYHNEHQADFRQKK